MHHYNDIIDIFNRCFYESYNTQLVKGDDEPIYLPACASSTFHRVIFAHGYYASAMHEIAHWCIAGSQRRLQEDYGYWYHPDGRDETTQAEFEKVEIKPQAIEWILSVAAGFEFKVSCDNLNGSFEPDRHVFKTKIHKQVSHYLERDLPERVATLAQALSAHYGVNYPLNLQQFN